MLRQIISSLTDSELKRELMELKMNSDSVEAVLNNCCMVAMDCANTIAPCEAIQQKGLDAMLNSFRTLQPSCNVSFVITLLFITCIKARCL